MSLPPEPPDLAAQLAAAEAEFHAFRTHLREIASTAGCLATEIREIDAKRRPPTVAEMRVMLEYFSDLDRLLDELRVRVAHEQLPLPLDL